MEIFFTRLSLLDEQGSTNATVQDESLNSDAGRGLGLRDSIPFILDSVGRYDCQLNRFLREVAAQGGASLQTARAYGYDVLSWSRFLAECRGPHGSDGRPAGKTIWEADRSDVLAYHQERRIGPGGVSANIAVSSWNRLVAALDRLYGWAKQEGIIKEVPFTYNPEQQHRTADSPWRRGPSNTALEAGARHHKVRWLSREQYVFFREVGLRGRFPDGTEDPHSRLRTGERNASFADVLVSSGARVSEAGSLLDREVPQPGSTILSRGQQSVPIELAPARCKGRKGRTVYLDLRVLAQADDYRRVERAVALDRRREMLRGPSATAVEHLTYSGRRGFRSESGGSISFATMTQADVQHSVERLADGSVVPAQFFLTESGDPLPPEAWWSIFVDASERCRQYGVELYVTPHVLRHTFAVHYLNHKIRNLIGTLDAREYRMDSTRQAYQRILSDPLRQLQRRLGHARIETTYHYLDHVADAQDLIDDAFASWMGSSDDDEQDDGAE